MNKFYLNIAFAIFASNFLGDFANAQSLMAFKTKALEEKPIAILPPVEISKPKQYSIQNQALIDAYKNPISEKSDLIAKQYSKPNELPYEAINPDKTVVYRANPYGPLRQRFYKVPMDVVAIEQLEITSATPKTNKPRGPIKAIYQDTKTAIVKDIPIAIADALPWVDKDKKNKDYEIVLKQVADSLNRAKMSDPEWVLPAKDELFELYRKLEELPQAPQLKEEYQMAAKYENQSLDERPFKKRPIWPGAKANVEVSVRPISVTNTGLDDQYNHHTNDEAFEEEVEHSTLEIKKSKQTPKAKINKKPLPKKTHH